MGIAQKHLSSDDLARVAGELLTNPRTNGLEMWAHCPFHTESTPGGAFSYNFGKDKAKCNSCGQTGDLVTVFTAVQGLSEKDGFLEFCRRYCPQALNQKGGRSSRPARTPELKRREPAVDRLEAVPVNDPALLWQEKAGKFLQWSQACLQRDQGLLEWLEARGIDKTTVERFRLGWNAGERGRDLFRERVAWGLPQERKEDGKTKKLWIPRGLVIPNFNSSGVLQRVRIRRPEGEPKYYVLPGSAHDPMPCLAIPSTWPGRFQALVICEAELDALALHQIAGDLVQVLSLGSASAKPRDPVSFEMCVRAAVILFALDRDQAGDKALSWWQTHFAQIKDIRMQDHKDPGEAVKAGVDLRDWILEHLPPAWKIGLQAAKKKGGSNDPPVEKQQQNLNCRGDNGDKDMINQCENHPEDLEPTEPIKRLREILEQEPIVLRKGGKGGRKGWSAMKQEHGGWVEDSTWWERNKDLGLELHRLFWKDPDIETFLWNHPDQEIDRKNFWKGLRVE